MFSTLEGLEEWVPQHQRTSEAVSKWSIGMQIHHCFQVAEAVSKRVAESVPGATKPSFSFLRSMLFLTGRIPRGRGKAPAPAIPPAQPTEDQIREIAARSLQACAELAAADALSWWRHPIFGVMQRDSSIRFIEIHTQHHLRIIRDIASHTQTQRS